MKFMTLNVNTKDISFLTVNIKLHEIRTLYLALQEVYQPSSIPGE